VNQEDLRDRHLTDSLLPNEAEEAGVRLGFFGQTRLPLVIEPHHAGVSLATWSAANDALIKRQLNRFGGLLFRGFEVDHDTFDGFIGNTSGGALPYTERSSPRTNVKGNIYTSTDYPAEYPIFLHNEQSYNTVFPRKIYFMCVTPPATQGATPIADVRNVLARLKPETREMFQRRKYAYVRNMGGVMGMHWKDVFQTADRAEVEKYCRDNDIAFEWVSDDHLRTCQIRDVIARHPDTAELCWFNHLTFFNVASLPADVSELLREDADEWDLPNHTFYGDRESIEASVMHELRSAYESESVSFDWEAQDVLMLDNMLVAHGRQPFSGQRRVITGLADPCEWRTVRYID
jgi:alpha-ketoglutarate-dependent taurine dioxygenase